MNEHERLATVLHVACLTEDRSGVEQRAMLDLAVRLDTELASFAAADAPDAPAPPRYTYEVDATYAPSEGRRIAPTADQRKRLVALEAKFDECEKCGVMAGAHAVDCFRADVEAYRAQHGPPEGALL